jgi:formiminotetrahydrofolate cyclodeaminase
MSIADSTLSDYLSALSSGSSTPGGGAVAALSGAQAASLISMVANLTKTFPEEDSKEQLLKTAEVAVATFTSLADQDAAAFAKLMTAYKEKGDVETASMDSATPPLDCLKLAHSLVASVQVLHQHGNPNLVTDTAIAALLLKDTILSSELNILINLRSIKNDDFKQAANQLIHDAKSTLPVLEDIASSIAKQLS